MSVILTLEIISVPKNALQLSKAYNINPSLFKNLYFLLRLESYNIFIGYKRYERKARTSEGNTNFPTPVPTLAVFDAALEAYSEACKNYQKGNILTSTVRDETRAALIEILNMLANYVELTSEFKEGMMVTSGFDLQKERTKRPVPSVPVILDITDGVKSGQIKLKVDSDFVNNFTTLYKLTGSDVQPQYKFGETKRVITIDGLEAGKYYSFQVSAANAAGESGWSAEQSFLVR